MGGTMRLGAWQCKLVPGSFAAKAYGKLEISERHRHRYEFNREHEKTLVGAGLKITGRTPDENYVGISEDSVHPWFLGCQFHPEFKSKPLEPHPLFAAFIGAALEHKKQRSRVASVSVAEHQPAPALRAAPRATPKRPKRFFFFLFVWLCFLKTPLVKWASQCSMPDAPMLSSLA